MGSIIDILSGFFFLFYPAVQIGKGFGCPVFHAAFDGDHLGRTGNGTHAAANAPVCIYSLNG